MKVTLEFDNVEEAVACINAELAWGCLRHCDNLIRNYIKHGDHSDLDKLLGTLRSEMLETLSVLERL